MEVCAIITEISEWLMLLFSLYYVMDVQFEAKKWYIPCVTLLVGGCIFIKYYFGLDALEYFLFKLIVLIGYIKIYYRERLLQVVYRMIVLYVIIEMLSVVLAIVTFPITMMIGIKAYTVEANILILCIRLIIYAGFIWWMKKKSANVANNHVFSVIHLGIIFVFIMIELSILKLKDMAFKTEDIQIYRMLLFGIIFSAIILILWIYDKRKAQKKFRELTSYAHRTREVIPSIGRVLRNVERLSESMEKSDAILKELQDICNADMEGARKEAASIKTFHSTGSVVLDDQLERYLEEAAEQDFNLEIIVRAPVTEILSKKQIGNYQLLQVVGDLYRNANKVIRKCAGRGMILICFGYNAEGIYEIAIYDNGEPFSKYVLEHLGERGVTTGGTGHGLADVFEVLRQKKASFVIDQALPKGSIFTKGISITFDGKENVEVKVKEDSIRRK